LKGEHAGLFNPSKQSPLSTNLLIQNTNPSPTDGRGYPDISAQGLYFEYVWNNTNGIISGTSAATPLASSILALVNDALISSGRKPLGFLNPWLYKTGYKGFTDILSGGNGGCNTTGFPVTKGWDAVTGFGRFSPLPVV
jgi:tripeptidyl-peptidase I